MRTDKKSHARKDYSMAKYKKKPIIIEAEQWFKNGDHSQDDCQQFDYTDGSGSFLTEGKIVRYYRHPQDSGDRSCEKCGKTMHVHGWIDTLEGGHIVCPGDWIITGVANEKYPCKPDIFEKNYEPVEHEHSTAEANVKIAHMKGLL